LAKNADPVAMLHQLLQQALRRLAPEAGRVCAELSSGLDSTLVALNVTEHLRSPIVTLGHAVVSQDSEAIAPRRQEAVARLGARDFCIWQEGLDEEAFPAPGRRFWPYHSLELTDMALVRQAASIGANIVFSGIGGDEMCALQEEERGAEAVARCFGRVVERSTGFLSLLPDGVKQENVPFWPPGLVPQSANDAPNWNAVRYLRRGLWPAHPLALATVQTFAHFLKPEWRRERYLSRDLLRRHGMSEAFLQQKPEEDLSPVYRKVMADERIFDLFFRDSILAAEGLLDMGKVRAAQETLRQNPHGKNDRASFPLTMAVLLERSLRSLAEPA
jgi:asparagine synthase (glutamine-hydrolysing)